MDLPLIDPPVAPRWVWMEEVTYSHIPIATLITAFLVLAPILEYIGYKLKDGRFDRLAKSLVFFTMILYSPGAALGTGIPMFIIGMWPEFWSRWANLFFWPLIVQFIFFLLDVAFLFFGYYLLWDKLQHRKRLHIFFGVMSAFFGLAIQAIWDSLGAYMTTPSVALPPLETPVGLSWAALFNPSFPYLFGHRFFANISYAMLLTGGVFAIKYWRRKAGPEKEYFGWAADLTFTIGFLAIFALPFIGWGFARVMQQAAPIAFQAVMGGHASEYFIIKMALIGLVLIFGAGYLFRRHRALTMRAAISLGLAGFWLVLSWHPPISLIPGGPVVWRLAYSAFILGLLAWLWLGSGGGNNSGHNKHDKPRWKMIMLAVGLASFVAFGLGGFVRERARQPYSVYAQLIKPEVTPLEADRWLTYDKCLGCHFKSPKELFASAETDWPARVARERTRPGVEISDEEARQIITFLKGGNR